MKEAPKVEKGIPIPKVLKAKTSLLIPVVRDMKVGDSIERKTANGVSYIRTLAYGLKYKIASRKMPNGTFRVWRVK